MSISSYLCLPLFKKNPAESHLCDSVQEVAFKALRTVLNEMEERSHCIELFPFQQAAHAILPALAPAIPFY